jgi:hypothetical protein
MTFNKAEGKLRDGESQPINCDGQIGIIVTQINFTLLNVALDSPHKPMQVRI